jgi:hypothetical protein
LLKFVKLRPLHGWREFVHEIVIVVIGVLLALAGAEMVENWRWQWQVRSARQSIANELVTDANQAAERIAVEDCLRDRIVKLAVKLKSSNGRWTADPMPLGPNAAPAPHWEDRAMGRVYEVPLVGWSQDAWDTAKSSGVADHMGHDDVASYSDVYGEIEGIREFQNQELMIESSLSFLSTDEQLDSAARNDALGKLGQLDSLNAVNAGLSSLVVGQMKDLHLPVDRARSTQLLNGELADARKWRGPCVKDVRVRY